MIGAEDIQGQVIAKKKWSCFCCLLLLRHRHDGQMVLPCMASGWHLQHFPSWPWESAQAQSRGPVARNVNVGRKMEASEGRGGTPPRGGFSTKIHAQYAPSKIIVLQYQGQMPGCPCERHYIVSMTCTSRAMCNTNYIRKGLTDLGSITCSAYLRICSVLFMSVHRNQEQDLSTEPSDIWARSL